ncbi:MAG: MlaD family protein [Acidobacteriota bacterium]
MSKTPKTSRYNQQFFRDWGAPGPLFFGLIAIILVIAGFYLAFTKNIPFTSPGYEVRATFSNAINIALKSPVRISGINVGVVTEVEASGDNTVVTFTVDGEGRPVREDAAAKIRPRLFLEGNWFIDLDPGTPEAAEIPDDGMIPVSRTSASVQIDQIVTTLQTPQRANLQRLLKGLGTGLNSEPTAAQDLTFEPFVKGLTGGEALNLAFRHGERASRGTAIVNEAFLGKNPHDLGNLLRGLSRVSGTLNEREGDLVGLINNLRIFTGALAAEQENLRSTIRQLGPTLQTTRRSLTSLNNALPALRGFAIAITPGLNEVPRTIRVVTPFTDQLKPLLTDRELGGLAKQIKKSAPASAESVNLTLQLLPQLEDYGRCVSGNLVPAGSQIIQDGAHGNGQTAFREFLYAAVNLAGAGQSFDGNGPYLQVVSGGGTLDVKTDDPDATLPTDKVLYGRTWAPPQGTSPIESGLPPLNADQPCYTQDVPDLNGPAAGPGAANPEVYTP